ncbi:hypothetical protein [Vulcaniibacterium tengchongense]|uniref:Uncharacterized protein n=1 Tax=Vulcaniibacterium tengchongense TaxID=1273429 RepID=A0A3N4VAQ5_9GAMM|nr:hypothetical protein [Vulcaniibacterium tengchongense]RPE79658.1 hypothetical protein EDC50_1481 [Vulcaniibacterium tengchongense]
MPRLLSRLAALLLAWSACVPLGARPRVELEVVDRDAGRALAQVAHRGQRWIAAAPGHRYAVRLRNAGPERVLVVLSVDGVNALTGQTAHPAQAGYVLGPWQRAEIPGWRKSLDEVAQFVFADVAASYAARTGQPENVGVIGMAVFAEARDADARIPAPGPPASVARESARPSGAGAAAAADALRASRQSLGTAHGAREWSPIATTGFVRASRRPAQMLELRYDDAAALLARGVPLVPPHPREIPGDRPRAFPVGFVPDP